MRGEVLEMRKQGATGCRIANLSSLFCERCGELLAKDRQKDAGPAPWWSDREVFAASVGLR